jgi:predicted transposase/invertase (TIGR01784 family)
VELKKALRIDGLYLPKKANMPLYFLEVQFQRIEKFYANLFAKVFCYLEENRPEQEWVAAAIFASKRLEPRHLGPYEDLLASKRVHRIYLDELILPPGLPLGLGILHLVIAAKEEVLQLAGLLIRKAKAEISDREQSSNVVELIEGLMLRRFTHMTREEIRAMILHDIRESKVWQEAHEEGQLMLKQRLAKKLTTDGRPIKEIAELLEAPVKEVRKWLQDPSSPQ